MTANSTKLEHYPPQPRLYNVYIRSRQQLKMRQKEARQIIVTTLESSQKCLPLPTASPRVQDLTAFQTPLQEQTNLQGPLQLSFSPYDYHTDGEHPKEKHF